MKRILLVLVFLVPACGGSDSDPATPAAPSGLSASLMTNQPHLVWTDNSSDETEFVIERKIGAGAFAEVATETFNIEQYHDMSAVPATDYTYRVKARNAAGDSAPSNEFQISTP